MLVHTATVRGRRLSWDVREVVQHGMNADRVELSLDDEWRACDRIVAVLAKAGSGATASIAANYIVIVYE